MKRYYIRDLLDEIFGKDNYTFVKRIYGGMMNVSYLVQDGNDKKYIIYIPNGKANKAVDRKIEKENTRIVEELGLTSKFIYFDDVRGIKIKEYIEGEPLNTTKYYIDYQAVANLLHLLHDSKELAPNDYHPFDRLAIYENRALNFARESNEYRKLRDFFYNHMKYLDVKKKVFSHNDFQKSNIIMGEDDKYYVIDFEFAGNNDEIYDIATFANDSIEDGEKLMRKYFVRPTKDEWRRFYLWRVFISLQWANVAISKHYQKEGKNTSFNFLDVSKYFVDNGSQAMNKYIELFEKK